MDFDGRSRAPFFCTHGGEKKTNEKKDNTQKKNAQHDEAKKTKSS
jgi:hypothetical protein